MLNKIVMGVDVGGSHITAALVDLSSRVILKDTWTRKSVNSHGEVAEIIASWSKAIKEVSGDSGFKVAKIGIGMPGPMDYENGTCFIKGQDKYEALYGLNLKSLLADALDLTPADIRLMNDAACFLQGEAFGGVGKGFSKVIGLTLGTGLGSAVYKDGITVDAGLWNSPFKDSFAEDYLSTRWFVKRYFECTGIAVENVKQLAHIAESDLAAQSVFDEFGRNLGLFLNGFIISEQPEAVVLGGNVAQSFGLFENSLRDTIADQYKNIDILKAVLGEEAALMGASSLWYTSSSVKEDLSA